MLDSNNILETASTPISNMQKMSSCCEETIGLHGANNPMMVCASCKQIIKCFDDEKAYRNYVRFCESRHRKILAMPYGSSHVVIFKNC